MQQSFRHFILVVFVALCLCNGSALAEAETSTLESELRQKIENGFIYSSSAKTHAYEAKALNDFFSAWYSKKVFRPFWIDSGVVSWRAFELIEAIEDAYGHGLNPETYFLTPIRKRLNSTDSKSLAELELLLMLAATTLSTDAKAGRMELRRIDAAEFSSVKFGRPELENILKEVIAHSDLGQAIANQFPRHKQYQKMKSALAAYRSIINEGDWTSVPSAGGPLKLGSSGPRVLALSQRLKETGDLPESSAIEETFNTTLEEATRLFQKRHGIPATGEVHQQTFAALNISAKKRMETLLINLERWRWLARDFSEGKEVFVNIAGFELFALEGSTLELRMPVIVGKAFNATPVFSGHIQQIEFNPYWKVPQSIAGTEILPKLKKNPNYLADEHMKLFKAGSGYKSEISPNSILWNTVSKAQMNRYTVRQEPGPWNALGFLKFIFPNPYSVYLHDTATRGLFSKHDRALSHGCIRVSSPVELAAFLLSTPKDNWNKDRVQELITMGGHQFVRLPKPVLLHLTYRTAWVDSDGTINFRPDVYKRDAKLVAVLK